MVVALLAALFPVVKIYFTPRVSYPLVPIFLAPPKLKSSFVPSNELNVTDVLLAPITRFPVFIGGHGIGKSTAFALAASQISKFRSVIYLKEPIDDVEFFKLFFVEPCNLFSSFVENSESYFNMAIDYILPPILIIDNVQTSSNLQALFHSVKGYTDNMSMKIILICSSSLKAYEIQKLSSMSRGRV